GRAPRGEEVDDDRPRPDEVAEPLLVAAVERHQSHLVERPRHVARRRQLVAPGGLVAGGAAVAVVEQREGAQRGGQGEGGRQEDRGEGDAAGCHGYDRTVGPAGRGNRRTGAGTSCSGAPRRRCVPGDAGRRRATGPFAAFAAVPVVV